MKLERMNVTKEVQPEGSTPEADQYGISRMGSLISSVA